MKLFRAAEALRQEADPKAAAMDKALKDLRRLKGILLKQNPANSAPAEDAFVTAIAVAKQQGTRSFELRAALALAKLYQATARPVGAHTVLAPALDGFAPTSQMPEIAEVKAETARRQRLTQLHAARGGLWPRLTEPGPSLSPAL
jgi:hypothetical protein